MELWGATAAPYPNRFLTVEDFWVHGAWTLCLFLYCLSQPLPTFGSHIIIHRRLQPGVICHRAMAVYVPYREKGTPYESSDRVQGTYRQIRVLFRRALPEWWVIKHHGGTAEKYNAPHTTTVLVVVGRLLRSRQSHRHNPPVRSVFIDNRSRHDTSLGGLGGGRFRSKFSGDDHEDPCPWNPIWCCALLNE